MSISNGPGMGGSPDESQVAFSLTTSQRPTRRQKARHKDYFICKPPRTPPLLVVVGANGLARHLRIRARNATRINFRRALLSRPDRRRIPAFYGFVLYAMAHLEAWHLALPKCQATTTRRRAASRWNFHRQIDKPRRMGGRPSNREHADRLPDNILCRRKPLVCVLQLLIEIIEVAWQYPPQTLRLLRRFCDVHELPGIIAQAGASFRTCSGLAEPFAALFSIRLAKNSAHSATLAAQRFV